MAAPGLAHFDYYYEILENAARRWARRKPQRDANLISVATGHLNEVETPERIAANEFYKQIAPQSIRRPQTAAEIAASSTILDSFAQERVIAERDFLGVEFLETAMAMARFVGRVHVRSDAGETLGYGTGFMVSPRLMLTNYHVLPTLDAAANSEVEFDYQRDRFGQLLTAKIYALEPSTFFLSDMKLDFALVAVQERSASNVAVGDYTWVKLRAPSGKALLGNPLNIIQHPRGELKQIVLRHNRLVDSFEDVVQYETDTEPGSSGSPVFSDNWNVVALHHSGVPKTNAQGQFLDNDGNVWVKGRDDPDRLAWVGNEGIRISSIMKFLQEANLDTATKLELRRQLLEDTPPNPLEAAQRGQVAIVNPANHPEGVSLGIGSGAVTISIPLQITVSLGTPVLPGAQILQPVIQTQPASTSVSPALAPVQAPQMTSGDGGGAGDTEALVANAKRTLLGPEVVDVELGYVYRNGWITNKRALMVTVQPTERKQGPLEASMFSLPESFQGLPLEIVGPSIPDLIRQARGPELAEATFDIGVQVEEITYVPPAGASLVQITEKMHVVAHVSPDVGWRELKKFLAGTDTRLVVGMYDFGAPHIVAAVKALDKNSFENMTLAIQRGESVGTGTKKHDLTDQAVVDALTNTFGAKFKQAWIKIGSVNGWVASSYHIKVAVRDENSFWLSSGNWQSSNQPDADPLHEHPRKIHWLREYNREWHAIVEHEGLAKAFQTYLLNDYEHNVGVVGPDELALPDLLVPEEVTGLEVEEAAPQFKYFAPFNENRVFTVLPLLTPDNYHDSVLELINSAEDELLLQNQTFNAPKATHDKLRELVGAVLARQQQGVKVRIIFRVFEDRKSMEQNLNALQDMGFDMNSIRVQTNCHTKGIVVDRKRVLLGSQNWSNDGVSVNRDASLLFDDEKLANYFAQIFDHDWNVLAKQNIGADPQPPELAVVNETTPTGMKRISWKDYMEMF